MNDQLFELCMVLLCLWVITGFVALYYRGLYLTAKKEKMDLLRIYTNGVQP